MHRDMSCYWSCCPLRDSCAREDERPYCRESNCVSIKELMEKVSRAEFNQYGPRRLKRRGI